MNINLTCPIDHSPLHKRDNTWQCTAQGHSFDCAKEGYVNLLPVQHKRSKAPGDNKQMVQARKQFLATDLYHPISEQINTLLFKHHHSTPTRVLDAGCGEGYYLQALYQQCSLKCDTQPLFCGLDISKFAVSAAAKSAKLQQLNIQWLVASNRQIPIKNHTLDALLCAFGFPVYPEFANKLVKGGLLLLVEAGEQHLIELKNIMYPDIKPYQAPCFKAAQAAGFTLIDEHNTTFNIKLDQRVLPNLLAMTPHLYRAPKEGLNALYKMPYINTTVDVNLYLFQCE